MKNNECVYYRYLHPAYHHLAIIRKTDEILANELDKISSQN